MGRVLRDGPPGLPCRRRGRRARRRRLGRHSLRRQSRAPQRRGDAAPADGTLRRDASARRLGQEERQRIDRPSGRAPSATLHRLRLDLARASVVPECLGRRRSAAPAGPRRAARLGPLQGNRRDFRGSFPFAGPGRDRLRPDGRDDDRRARPGPQVPCAGPVARRVDADARALEPAREVSRRPGHLGAWRLHAACSSRAG